MSIYNNNKYPINKVEWDKQSESYKLVSNSNWNLSTQVEVYSDFVSQGLNDELASSILDMINQTRPVYSCSCYSDHELPGYSFNPCPCFTCEINARRDGFDITEPISSISLHKNTVHVIGNMILTDHLDQINQILNPQHFITKEHFIAFQSLLLHYGETQKSWTEVVDSFQTEDNDFWHSFSVLEQFWIHFMLTNSNIQPPSL
jgi:hypothetical protein